jgi:hypothetical protein
MSWQTINKILGLAMIDEAFAEHLLKEPQEALNTYGIKLPPEELTVICSCQAQTILELSQQLVEKLGPESL